MLRMIYTSESNIDSGEMLRQVRAIHAASVDNNKDAGVTGALLYSDLYFLQILEGEDAAVRQTFERIKQDDRHRNVQVISEGPIASRTFGPWSMRLVLRDGAADAIFRQLGLGPVFNPVNLSPQDALRLLSSLASRTEEAGRDRTGKTG